MNILIVGDSFAADWSCKYPGCKGWPNLLAEKFPITNLAQAGVSEYKIWLQIQSAEISRYSHVIIAHTSPFRIPVDRHPWHHQDALHHSCDLIYKDIKAQDDPSLSCIVEFFEKWFDLNYAKFVHQLIIDKELEHFKNYPEVKILHVTNLEIDIYIGGQDCKNYHKVFKKNPGLINHFDDKGNNIISQDISTWLLKN